MFKLEMKENCTNWGLSHSSTTVTKVGGIENPVSIPGCSQQRLLKKISNFEKFSPSQKFQLIPKIVYTPENYKIIRRFTNSAEDLSNVIIKNDQN